VEQKETAYALLREYLSKISLVKVGQTLPADNADVEPPQKKPKPSPSLSDLEDSNDSDVNLPVDELDSYLQSRVPKEKST